MQRSNRLGRSGKALHPARGTSLWLTKENHIRQRHTIHKQLHEGTLLHPWDKAKHQYSLSPTDRWAKRTNESIPRAVPTDSLQTGSTRMGRMAPSRPICTKLLAIQHNQENPLRINPQIYPKHTSAKQSDISTRNYEETRTNKGTSPSSATHAQTSTTTVNQRNKVQT